MHKIPRPVKLTNPYKSKRFSDRLNLLVNCYYPSMSASSNYLVLLTREFAGDLCNDYATVSNNKGIEQILLRTETYYAAQQH